MLRAVKDTHRACRCGVAPVVPGRYASRLWSSVELHRHRDTHASAFQIDPACAGPSIDARPTPMSDRERRNQVEEADLFADTELLVYGAFREDTFRR